MKGKGCDRITFLRLEVDYPASYSQQNAQYLGFIHQVRLLMLQVVMLVAAVVVLVARPSSPSTLLARRTGLPASQDGE